MIYNIQIKLALKKGMEGGWSLIASKEMLDMLKKAKVQRTHNEAASCSSSPLAIRHRQDTPLAAKDEPINAGTVCQEMNIEEMDEDKDTEKANSDNSENDSDSSSGKNSDMDDWHDTYALRAGHG